jgi:hypothetical protein
MARGAECFEVHADLLLAKRVVVPVVTLEMTAVSRAARVLTLWTSRALPLAGGAPMAGRAIKPGVESKQMAKVLWRPARRRDPIRETVLEIETGFEDHRCPVSKQFGDITL